VTLRDLMVAKAARLSGEALAPAFYLRSSPFFHGALQSNGLHRIG
jgi:hypothetical protein